MPLDIAEHGAAGPAEGEEAHRGGNTDIDADHGRPDPVFEFPGSRPAGGIDTGGIG